ncbi:hypothetical protein IFM89_037087 [Coptis chinensis]|uniref:Uncharacterized protein n=1 Tax=Coptis chinensis TaxID=261450 RepID=A0A835HSR0_9MAGN|nr:hypothetical protein IFM89_037087 [Coptis chinensis]
MDTGMGMVKEGSDPEHDGSPSHERGIVQGSKEMFPIAVYANHLSWIYRQNPLQPTGCQLLQRGVITSWIRDRDNARSSFQISVSSAGTTNKAVRAPKNFI